MASCDVCQTRRIASSPSRATAFSGPSRSRPRPPPLTRRRVGAGERARPAAPVLPAGRAEEPTSVPACRDSGNRGGMERFYYAVFQLWLGAQLPAGIFERG